MTISTNDAGSSTYPHSTSIFQSISTNTLSLSESCSEFFVYPSLITESVSASSLESVDYHYPAKGIPPPPPHTKSSKRVHLVSLNHSLALVTGHQLPRSSDVLLSGPTLARVKSIPKAVARTERWASTITSGRPPQVVPWTASRDNEPKASWKPEGTMFSLDSIRSKTLGPQNGASEKNRTQRSRCSSPAGADTRLSVNMLNSGAGCITRRVSFEANPNAFHREALVIDSSLHITSPLGSRRWSVSAPEKLCEAGHSTMIQADRLLRLNVSTIEYPDSTSSHADNMADVLPKIKLSTSENTLAISIPSVDTASDRPSHLPLAVRRGHPVPTRLSLDTPQYFVNSNFGPYPGLPTSLLFSPSGDFVRPSLTRTGRPLSAAPESLDTSSMINELRAKARALKPQTPVEANLEHAPSDDKDKTKRPVLSKLPSDESLASHHSVGTAGSHALSCVSEDEWAFARDIMEKSGDPLPPRSPKKSSTPKSRDIPPVPQIPSSYRAMSPVNVAPAVKRPQAAKIGTRKAPSIAAPAPASKSKTDASSSRKRPQSTGGDPKKIGGQSASTTRPASSSLVSGAATSRPLSAVERSRQSSRSLRGVKPQTFVQKSASVRPPSKVFTGSTRSGSATKLVTRTSSSQPGHILVGATSGASQRTQLAAYPRKSNTQDIVGSDKSSDAAQSELAQPSGRATAQNICLGRVKDATENQPSACGPTGKQCDAVPSLPQLDIGAAMDEMVFPAPSSPITTVPEREVRSPSPMQLQPRSILKQPKNVRFAMDKDLGVPESTASCSSPRSPIIPRQPSPLRQSHVASMAMGEDDDSPTQSLKRVLRKNKASSMLLEARPSSMRENNRRRSVQVASRSRLGKEPGLDIGSRASLPAAGLNGKPWSFSIGRSSDKENKFRLSLGGGISPSKRENQVDENVARRAESVKKSPLRSILGRLGV